MSPHENPQPRDKLADAPAVILRACRADLPFAGAAVSSAARRVGKGFLHRPRGAQSSPGVAIIRRSRDARLSLRLSRRSSAAPPLLAEALRSPRRVIYPRQ